MGIREIIVTPTEPASSATGRVHHHHHAGGPNEAEISANQAAARAPKHERISLKKLHSLRNQLFCGFKSFSASNDPPPPQAQSVQTDSTVATSPNQHEEAPAEVASTKIEASEEELKVEKSPVFKDANQVVFNLMMIVDQRNATLGYCEGAAGLSGKSSRNSKSSSWASLSNNQQSSSGAECSNLTALLAHQSAGDSDQPATVQAARGCSFKRASYRRLTGKGSTRKQLSDEKPSEKMIKLIKHLDIMAKSFEHDNQEPARATSYEDDVFYLEKSWTEFVRLDDHEAAKEQAADSDSENKQTPRSNFEIQQDAIWELLTSEVFYLRRLQVILGVFLETLAELQQNSLLLEVSYESIGDASSVNPLSGFLTFSHSFYATNTDRSGQFDEQH